MVAICRYLNRYTAPDESWDVDFVNNGVHSGSLRRFSAFKISTLIS